jgi:hypothetical protein
VSKTKKGGKKTSQSENEDHQFDACEQAISNAHKLLDGQMYPQPTNMVSITGENIETHAPKPQINTQPPTDASEHAPQERKKHNTRSKVIRRELPTPGQTPIPNREAQLPSRKKLHSTVNTR